MISNLDESEFGNMRKEDNSGAIPRGSEFATEGIRADAPLRDFIAEAAERNWKFNEAIALEEIRIQNAKLAKLRLESESLELDNREQALAIRERSLASNSSARTGS